MKLTTSRLNQIIQEETKSAIAEGMPHVPPRVHASGTSLPAIREYLDMREVAGISDEALKQHVLDNEKAFRNFIEEIQRYYRSAYTAQPSPRLQRRMRGKFT